MPVYDADLSVLTERNREILRLRFEEKLTLEAIGKQYGIGGERVRQIVMESFILNFLKKITLKRLLSSYSG